MINENNYETYLMSYIDNELSADQRAAVEAFVSTNTKYAKALSVFKTTKLEAPFIEMKDKIFLYRFPEMQASLETNFKKSLYKKEAPSQKLNLLQISLRVAYAIAAMLILFLGLPLLPTDKKVENKNALAQSQPIQKITSITPQKQNKIQVNNLSKTISVATNTTNNNSTSNTVILNDAKSSPNNSSVNATVVTPATPINSITVTSNTQEEAITLQQATISTQKLDNKDIIENTIMSNAVYQEINTESQDNTIHIGMFEINGASLRGITRKVSAIFRKNKTEIENKYEK